jgi:hypothetical protein
MMTVRMYWMKHRRRLFLLLVLLLLIGGAFLVPSVRWPIYGWLRGEAFYQLTFRTCT